MAADREQIPAEQTCEKGNKLDKGQLYVKSCTLEAFWAVRLKPGKISDNVKIVENHRNSNQIMYSKSFLDGQAEAWESKRKLQNLIKSQESM